MYRYSNIKKYRPTRMHKTEAASFAKRGMMLDVGFFPRGGEDGLKHQRLVDLIAINQRSL